jgi:hypothetical protein
VPPTRSSLQNFRFAPLALCPSYLLFSSCFSSLYLILLPFLLLLKDPSVYFFRPCLCLFLCLCSCPFSPFLTITSVMSVIFHTIGAARCPCTNVPWCQQDSSPNFPTNTHSGPFFLLSLLPLLKTSFYVPYVLPFFNVFLYDHEFLSFFDMSSLLWLFSLISTSSLSFLLSFLNFSTFGKLLYNLIMLLVFLCCIGFASRNKKQTSSFVPLCSRLSVFSLSPAHTTPTRQVNPFARHLQ